MLARPIAVELPRPIQIGMACNNPDTGLFDSCAWMIHFPANSLELFSRDWGRAPRLVELDDSIRLSGKRWPVIGARFGDGNWCWNSYAMTAEVATEFLIWLKGRRLYQFDSGWEQLADWWRDPKSPMDPAFIAKILRDAAAQDA